MTSNLGNNINSINSSESPLFALDDLASPNFRAHVSYNKGKDSTADELPSFKQQDNERHTDDELDKINANYLEENIDHEEYCFQDYDEEMAPESGDFVCNAIESHPYVVAILKELKSAGNELDCCKKSNHQLKISNEDLQEKLEILETEKELLREEMLANNEENQATPLDSFPTSETVEKLEKQLQEIRRDGEELVNSYKTRLHKMAVDCSSAIKDREVSEEENQELKNKVAKFNLEREKLIETTTKLTSEVSRLTVDYKQLETEYVSHKEVTNNKINELDEEVGQLTEQLASARGQSAEYMIDYERENKNLESRFKSLGEINRNLEKQKRHLENQRSELQSRKDTLTLEQDKLMSRLNDITENIDLTAKKITSAQERLEEQKVQLSAVRSNYSEEMSRLLEENEILKAERDGLESQAKAREHDVESLITQNEELEQKIAYMGQYLQELKDVFDEVKELEPKSNNSSDATKAREILLHLRKVSENLKKKNSSLFDELLAANDKIQRLEIQLNEMAGLVKNFEELQSKSTQGSHNRNGPINMGSEDEERLVSLESEVLALRTQCASLEAELISRKDQVLQLDKLRLSSDTTKKQLMEREAEIAELKSKLELNELEMKSKNLMIGQLQNAYQEVRNHKDQNAGNVSSSTISSGGNSLVVQYEQMIEDMRDKLDKANVENGKLRYQLSEAAQKALDSVNTATIQELKLQNAELKRILMSREEELMKEQSKYFDRTNKSTLLSPGERIRGEIVEGISELMDSSVYTDNKVMDVTLSQDLSFFCNSELAANRRSTFTPRRTSFRSIQPDMKALKVQVDNLHKQLESKNFDLEKAMFTAQNLSQKLEDARGKIHFMEECIQSIDKTIVMLRDELIRKQQHVIDLESQLQNGICFRCGLNSDDSTSDLNNGASNRSIMLEGDIDATLKKNLQTIQYMDELIRVFAQQNNLSQNSLNQKDTTFSGQNVQSLLEGLYQQTANMHQVIEDNAGLLKRLVEASLSDTPSKRQSRFNSRISKYSNTTNNNLADTVEIKRQDLHAIIRAGNDMLKSPAQFVSQIDNFASVILDQDRDKSEIVDGIHIFKELAPTLEKYVKKFEACSKSHQELLKDFTASRKLLDGNSETKNQINVLITNGHELATDSLQLSIQIKEVISLLTTLTSEDHVISNSSASILVVQEIDNHQKEIEKLRKLVVTQTQIIAEYEANIELTKQKDEQVKSLRATLATLAKLKNVDQGKTDSDDKYKLLTKCEEFYNLWLQEVNINSSLREVFKDLKISSSSKEKEMKLRIESLTAQVNGSSQQLQNFKIQAEKFEEKYQKSEAALKEQVQQYEKLKRDWADLIETHKADLEALKHRWTKERKTLQEANKNTKVQQLADIEAGHNKLQDAWRKEKESIAKKNRVLKESHQKEIKGLQKEIEKLTSKIHELDNEISSVSAEKRALSLEKTAITKDKTELQQKVENLEKESVRYQSKQASAVELNKQIRNLQKERDVAVEKANQKIVDLEAALKLEQESKVQLNRVKNNALKEITSLKNQNRHMKALEVEIENITEQLQSERRDHQEKNTQLSDYEDQLQSEQERYRELLVKVTKLEKNKSTSCDDEQIFQIMEENKQLKDDLQVLDAQIKAVRKEMIDQEVDSQHKTSKNEEDDYFKQKYKDEKRQHVDDCNLLFKEVKFLKAKCHRESGFRADLCYQKKFLMLLIGGIESCEQATLLLIQNIHNPSRIACIQSSPLLVKFRGVVNAVIAIQRMRILKNNWGKNKNMKKTIQQQYQRLHKNNQ
ncbi:12966_t:CDS:10 [Funneliformis geosporum]|uniref:12966_t:CDS:1 n=1 Tax=Funneliformis geosporum TaxID=1117311 RepID=A0A9W4SDK7_9GLOM|nr:12966_t:CDS:10 [Funneliformis geosporum]